MHDGRDGFRVRLLKRADQGHDLGLVHLLDDLESRANNASVAEALARAFATRPRADWFDRFGMRQVSPAPRFSETPSAIRSPPAKPGSHTGEILKELGYDEKDIGDIVASGAIGSDAT